MFKHLMKLKVSGILVIFLTLAGTFQALAQNRISGKVVDTAGQPVIGAAVLVPGTTNGATTDLDGVFQINVAPGTNLEFSCIGYVTRRVPAAADMTVLLEEDSEMIEETVVIG